MNYYISDLHIGCNNKYEGRTIEYHDKLLKENWNKIVTNADDVYILGDIGRIGNNKDNEYLISIISTLKVKKHLIVGNHDKLKDIRLRQLFVEICDYKEIVDNFNNMTNKLVLSHYPILHWNGQHDKAILLYGHVHNSDEEQVFQYALNMVNFYFNKRTEEGRTDCPQCTAINVGAMMPYINYCPKTLNELINKNS